MDGPIYEAEARKKADEFLMGQQLYYRAVKNQNEEVERFRRTRSEYQQALELLEELPTRTRHGIMVPLGSKAFMPGLLVHTNEVMVLLGDNYFAERSAKQTSDIVRRRLLVIEELIEKADKRTKDLLARADLSEQAKRALERGMSEGRKDCSLPEGREKGIVKFEATREGCRPESRKEACKIAPALQPDTSRVTIQDKDDEEDDQATDEEEDVGKGPDFWRSAGFIGAWVDEPEESEEGEEEDDDVYDQVGPTARDSQEPLWDDTEPVFEIRELEDGMPGEVVEHPSQTAFEQSSKNPL